MTSLFKKIIMTIVLSIFFLSIIGYGFLKLKHIIDGPTIEKTNLEEVTSTTNSYLIASGFVKNTVKLELNGKPLFITKNREFREDIILVPGYNIIELDLEDRFGKKKNYHFHIILKGDGYDILNADEEEIISDKKQETKNTQITNPKQN